MYACVVAAANVHFGVVPWPAALHAQTVSFGSSSGWLVLGWAGFKATACTEHSLHYAILLLRVDGNACSSLNIAPSSRHTVAALLPIVHLQFWLLCFGCFLFSLLNALDDISPRSAEKTWQRCPRPKACVYVCESGLIR